MDVLSAEQRRHRRRVPNDKRKRAALACAQCKARKSKCVRVASGSCQRCVKSALVCQYRRRSTSPGGGGLSPDLSLSSRGLHDTAAQDIYATPTASITTENCQSESFMWPGFLAKLRESFSLDPHQVGQRSLKNDAPMQSQLAPELRAAELRRLKVAIDAFPPRPLAKHLLSACIEHAIDAFFYFDQAELALEIDEFYTDLKSSLRQDAGFVCLAHAVFALGSQWVSLAYSQPPSPVDDDTGRVFYEQARSLVPDLDDSSSLRSVQAPFILGVYLLPARATGSLHMYLGHALRKALALDLHLSTECSNFSEKQREVRSRLWIITVKLNRPRSVDCAIITTAMPQALPALDCAQKFDNSSHQIANAQLTVILDKLSDCSRWTSDSRLTIDAKHALKTWKQSLPPMLRLENVPAASSSFRATFHLHLNYYFALIAMGKYAVVSEVRSRLRSTIGNDASTACPMASPSQLSVSCVKAAKKMLRLFEKIYTSGKMTKSSFTDFQGCSIATMVLLVAGVVERDLCYNVQVPFGLDCLRQMAGGHATALTGVAFMEALQSIVDEAAEKLRNVRHNATVGAAQMPEPTQTATTQVPSAFDSTLHTDMQPWSTSSLDPILSDGSGHAQLFAEATYAENRSTNVQQTPRMSIYDTARAEQGSSAWAPGLVATGDPFAMLQFDNEAFLMELTGLDVLNIPGA